MPGHKPFADLSRGSARTPPPQGHGLYTPAFQERAISSHASAAQATISNGNLSTAQFERELEAALRKAIDVNS